MRSSLLARQTRVTNVHVFCHKGAPNAGRYLWTLWRRLHPRSWIPEDVSFCIQTAMSGVWIQTFALAVMNLALSYNWTCACCLLLCLLQSLPTVVLFRPTAPQFIPPFPNLWHICLTRVIKPLVWCHVLWQTPMERGFVVCLLAEVLRGWIVWSKFRFHKYTY